MSEREDIDDATATLRQSVIEAKATGTACGISAGRFLN